MLMEDRTITTDELHRQAALGLDADILLPAGVLETLEDPAFHMLIPAGRAHGPETDKLLAELILDSQDGEIRIQVMVEDDWFCRLPTSFHTLRNVRDLVPDAVQCELEDYECEEEPF